MIVKELRDDINICEYTAYFQLSRQEEITYSNLG